MILRLLVIGLIVANIVLWGWASLQPEPRTAPAEQTSSGVTQISSVPSIRLARESAIGPPGGSQASRQCYTLGPLQSRSAMQVIQDELERSVIQLSWHQSSVVVEQGFWVYFEPFDSYRQAAEAVDLLVENGVRDYYVMPDGPYANAVSVGLFERQAQAEARKEAIEALGLGWPVKVEMQRKDEARYWLDFELRPDRQVDVQELIAGQPGAQHLEVPCPENEASFPPA